MRITRFNLQAQSVQTCSNISSKIFQGFLLTEAVHLFCSTLTGRFQVIQHHPLGVVHQSQRRASSGSKVWHDAIVKDAAHSLTTVVSSWTWDDEMNLKWIEMDWNGLKRIETDWNGLKRIEMMTFCIHSISFRKKTVYISDHPKAPQTRTRLGSPLHAVPARMGRSQKSLKTHRL